MALTAETARREFVFARRKIQSPALRVQRELMDRSRLKLDIIALSVFFCIVFFALSLLSYDPADPPSSFNWPPNSSVRNLCGTVGATVAFGTIAGIGAGVFVLFAGLVVLDVLLFLRRSASDKMLRLVGWLLILSGTSAVADKLFPTVGPSTPVGSGGYWGAFLIHLLEAYFSAAGTWLILVAMFVVGLLLTVDYVLLRAARLSLCLLRSVVSRPWRLLVAKPKRRSASHPNGKVIETPIPVAVTETGRNDHDSETEESGQSRVQPATSIPLNTPDEAGVELSDEDLASRLDQASTSVVDNLPHQLPTFDLLEDPEPFPYDEQTASIRKKARLLEKKLAEFGYKVRVVQIDTGPVITQFEVALEAGLRVNKIHSLADDLAISLKAPSVRIVAPIPGRATVGIEVPNDRRAKVQLKAVIRGLGEKAAKMRIPLFLGDDVKGNPMVYDLTEMPHLLIAGRTGTGKSVCLNAMILSILMTRRPDEVKMLMIDPKMVELSQYRRIPHLMHPVVTDMKKAEAMLAWAVDKMEERYDLLARAGVRHMSTYNQLGAEEIYARLKPEDEEERARIPEHMAYIVIFADEMADLMMTAPKEVEGHIIRLAQKSRAVGIHLIVATQKPTVDVITGLIKSNLPCRIAFQVSSRSDSRVVLDESGAEKLLGHGDMLFLVPGTSQLVRAQGTYAGDAEIDGVVQFLENYEPEYAHELIQLNTSGSDKKDYTASLRDRDELYEEAIDIVVREGRGSVSLLQRGLGIGYGRAARLIDYMAEDGLVGDYNGSQAREVLCTPEQWEEMKFKEPSV